MFNTELSSKRLFTNRQLAALIIPLVIEQFLSLFIGMVDTVMVSSVSEAAVSAVSLVDSINTLFIQLFSAMATGGAVVVAQYLGKQDSSGASSAAKQLLYATLILSCVIAAVSILFCGPILRLCYGAVSEEIMQNCQTYFYYSAISYPAIAVYNGAAALLRSMRKSSASMTTSFVMNLVNVCGNALMIYGLRMGVAGAALASLLARVVGAALMAWKLFRPGMPVQIQRILRPEFNAGMIRKIFRLGIPNGLENCMFHFGKLLVLGLVSAMGEAMIAANAVSNTVAVLCNVVGTSICMATLTVVGQCAGAGDEKQIRYYSRKLIGIVYVSNAVIHAALFVLAEPVTLLFSLSQEARMMTGELLRWYAVAATVIWPVSFVLPYSLRAVGDARYPMVVSISSMWVFRVLTSFLLVNVFHMGLMGVWLGMYIDWIGRIVFIVPRYLGSKWLTKRVV